ncbi:sensor histidine kinase [Pelagovum sp. HNIBRBA483]|uniref:sensor histidine kinase n=1 Tax=Pelagovum sp. HNIBRBA483 TaxID=3233341 RepID=UPI0034A18AEA
MPAQTAGDDTNIFLSKTLVRLALVFGIAWALLALMLRAPHLFSAAGLSVAGFLAAIFLHSVEKHFSARIVWILAANAAIFWGSLVVHDDGHLSFMFVLTAGLPFALFDWDRYKRLTAALAGLSFLLWLVSIFLHFYLLSNFEIVDNTALLVSTLLVGLTIFSMVGAELAYFSFYHSKFGSELNKALRLSKSLGESRLQFLRSVNHEIRTPLNAIVGLTSLLRENTELDNATAEKVDMIHDSGMRITEMVGKSDKLVALREDDRSDMLVRTDIADFVEKTTRAFFEDAPDRPLFFDVRSRQVFLTNKEILEAAIAELLDNVKKYTPSNVPLTVRIDDDDDYVSIAFVDAGTGFDRDRLTDVIGGFARLTEGHGTVRGLGIGLTIAMEAALRLGGHLEVSNHAEGGAVQTLYIPAS